MNTALTLLLIAEALASGTVVGLLAGILIPTPKRRRQEAEAAANRAAEHVIADLRLDAQAEQISRKLSHSSGANA